MRYERRRYASGPYDPVWAARGRTRAGAIQLALPKRGKNRARLARVSESGSRRRGLRLPPRPLPGLHSPADPRPRRGRRLHPAGCARKGRASGKENTTSRPRRGHTWALQAAGGRPAPGSSESGPPPRGPAGAARWAGRPRSSAGRKRPSGCQEGGAWATVVTP